MCNGFRKCLSVCSSVVRLQNKLIISETTFIDLRLSKDKMYHEAEVGAIDLRAKGPGVNLFYTSRDFEISFFKI